MADILVLNFNDFQTTATLLKTIVGYKNINRVLIVDNNSTDDSFEMLKNFRSDKVEVIKTDKNGGYGYGNNYGVKYLRKKYHSKYVIIANPDVLFSDESVLAMEVFLKNNETYAVVAPVMHDSSDNKMPNFGWNIPKKSSYIFEMGLIGAKMVSKRIPKYDFTQQIINLDAVAGSLFMINTDSFFKAGCYDENVFLYCEETILGFKLKKSGYQSAVMTNLSYIHNHSVSISKTFKTQYKRRKLMIKSKLYVLKNYYHANFIDMFVARIVAFFSLIEVLLISPFKK